MTSKQVTTQARAAGYEVITIEQLRPNRWLMLLSDPSGDTSIVLAQQRLLLGSTDVEDLADLLRLRHAKQGILLALGGTFSALAQHTALGLRDTRVLLYTSLPQAHVPQKPSPALSSI